MDVFVCLYICIDYLLLLVNVYFNHPSGWVCCVTAFLWWQVIIKVKPDWLGGVLILLAWTFLIYRRPVVSMFFLLSDDVLESPIDWNRKTPHESDTHDPNHGVMEPAAFYLSSGERSGRRQRWSTPGPQNSRPRFPPRRPRSDTYLQHTTFVYRHAVHSPASSTSHDPRWFRNSRPSVY